jgi:hypothetical protein
MACVESFARHEDGAVGHDDWPALVQILERELALLTRLARENVEPSDELAIRADALHERYTSLSKHIAAARRRDEEELASLGETNRRVRAIKHAYS